MECKDCPAKRLCDSGIKPKSCEKANPKPNKEMFDDLFKGDNNPFKDLFK